MSARLGPIAANWLEDADASVASLRTIGTTATSACAGNDSRMSDSRNPTAHATSHAIGGSDEPSGLWSYPWRRKLISYHNDAGATTIQSVGIAAPTTEGTLANSDAANGCAMVFVSGAVNGNSAGLYSAFTITRRDWLPVFSARVLTHSNIASTRLWLGLFSTDPKSTGAATAIHCAAIGYDTGIDGTAFWRSITSNGAAETRTALATAIATSTSYTIRIECQASSVLFYINDVLVRTETSTLPTSTQLLGVALRITTLTGAAKRLHFGRVAMMTT